MKVLIIDDEADVRHIAGLSLLRAGGMTVVEASNGEDGVACARSEQPDVILLDMMMPGMDGAATFHALRESRQTSGIPVVFLTGRALTPEVQRLKDLGAKGALLKPFDPLTLVTEIRTILTS